MSTETAIIAGVQFIEQRPTHDTNIEYWLAKCGDRLSEVFLLPKQYHERLQTLPNLIGFTQCRIVEVDAQLAVIMPGIIQVPTTQMIAKIGVTGCVGMAWHISDMLSLLHQSGRAHNLLHPESIGLNDLGELEVRPALGRFIASDPDTKASAIATDCWQMRSIIHHLGISHKVDPLFALLNRGLQEELARLRLQPATAIRQSIAAVLARHSDWEDKFIDRMGPDWALNQRNLQESTIIPHRLKSTRPTLSIDDVKDMADSIDLWGNLFTSSSIDEASSSQALLLEALSGKQPSKQESLASKIQLPTHRGEPIEENSSRLEIDLIGPTSIQVPVQAKRPGLVSIQEVGINESPTIEEQDFYHGFSAIVEETADDLEVIHRRRRSSQSRRDSHPYGKAESQSPLFEELTEVIVPPVADTISFDEPAIEEVVEDPSALDVLVEESISVDLEPTQVIQSDPAFVEPVSADDTPPVSIELSSQEEISIETPTKEVETLHLDQVEVDSDELELYESESHHPIVEISIETNQSTSDADGEDSKAPAVFLEEESEQMEERAVGVPIHQGSEPIERELNAVGLEIEIIDVETERLNSDDSELRDVVSQIQAFEQSSIEVSQPTNDETRLEDSYVEDLSADSATPIASEDIQTAEPVEPVEIEVRTPVTTEDVAPELGAQEEPESSEESGDEKSVLQEQLEGAVVDGAVQDLNTDSIVSIEPSISDFVATEDSAQDTIYDGAQAIEITAEEPIEAAVVSSSSVPLPDEAVVESLSEELEESESSEESETTSPVSIHNMPLISIVEEDDFNSNEPSEESEEESEDEAGVSLPFLMDSSEQTTNRDSLEQVFEADSTSSTFDSDARSESGFVATLNLGTSTMSSGTLDVEEPLADIEFPSIEEVRAQDKTFAGDVNALFDSSGPAVAPLSNKVQPNLTQSSTSEPKWTGATSFDNLTNAEDALGDEKYAYAQVELGDVDAVLGESIRDFSELERRGSPWGMLLIISLVLICAIVYVLNLDTPSPSEAEGLMARDIPAEPIFTQVEIQTDPPRGTVLIESNSLGVAPVQWKITDGSVFLVCVDWGSNPVCRRVPRSDLQTETYTFTQRLTP